MKTYGLTDRAQRGCCPGHDDFPCEHYRNRRSRRKYRAVTKIMRRRERRSIRQNLKREG